jgi:hypothetical protein
MMEGALTLFNFQGSNHCPSRFISVFEHLIHLLDTIFLNYNYTHYMRVMKDYLCKNALSHTIGSDEKSPATIGQGCIPLLLRA